MKRLVVAGLLRLYPSRWRAEYGEEIAEILMRRPLSVGAAADVVANAVRQQWRLQPPWLMVAAPLLLWMIAYLVLSYAAPTPARALGGKPTLIGIALFFGVGFWTVLRSGEGGGKAAMKLSIVVTLPVLLLGLLAMVHLVSIPVTRDGSLAFGGPPDDAALIRLVIAPILQIPYAGVLGWYGGLAARLARRIRS